MNYSDIEDYKQKRTLRRRKLSRVEEENNHKFTPCHSLYPLQSTTGVFDATADDLRNSISNKKNKKSVHTLPNIQDSLKQDEIMYSDDSDYHCQINVKKKEMRDFQTKPNDILRRQSNKNIGRYKDDWVTNRYAVSKVVRKDEGDAKKLSTKQVKASEGVKGNEVWAVLRNLKHNRFKFPVSPPMSDKSLIVTSKRTVSQKQKNCRGRNSRSTKRLIETCRTEKISYVTNFEVESTNFVHNNDDYSRSSSQSFDRITVIDQNERQIQDLIKKMTHKKKTDIERNNIYQNAISQSNLGKINKKKKPIKIGQRHRQHEISSNKDSYPSITFESSSRCSNNSKNDRSTTDSSRVFLRVNDSTTDSTDVSQLSGTSSVISNNHRQHSRDRKPRLVTTIPSSDILSSKHTYTNGIKNKFSQMKFPIIILKENELSSDFEVVKYNHPQFDGLDKKIWPFMKDWVDNNVEMEAADNSFRANILKNNNNLSTYVEEPSSLNRQSYELKHKNFHSASSKKTTAQTTLSPTLNNCTKSTTHHNIEFLLKPPSLSETSAKMSSGNVSCECRKDVSQKMDDCPTKLRPQSDSNTMPLLKKPRLLVRKRVNKCIWAKEQIINDFIDKVLKKIETGVYYILDVQKSLCTISRNPLKNYHKENSQKNADDDCKKESALNCIAVEEALIQTDTVNAIIKCKEILSMKPISTLDIVAKTNSNSETEIISVEDKNTIMTEIKRTSNLKDCLKNRMVLTDDDQILSESDESTGGLQTSSYILNAERPKITLELQEAFSPKVLVQTASGSSSSASLTYCSTDTPNSDMMLSIASNTRSSKCLLRNSLNSIASLFNPQSILDRVRNDKHQLKKHRKPKISEITIMLKELCKHPLQLKPYLSHIYCIDSNKTQGTHTICQAHMSKPIKSVQQISLRYTNNKTLTKIMITKCENFLVFRRLLQNACGFIKAESLILDITNIKGLGLNNTPSVKNSLSIFNSRLQCRNVRSNSLMEIEYNNMRQIEYFDNNNENFDRQNKFIVAHGDCIVNSEDELLDSNTDCENKGIVELYDSDTDDENKSVIESNHYILNSDSEFIDYNTDDEGIGNTANEANDRSIECTCSSVDYTYPSIDSNDVFYPAMASSSEDGLTIISSGETKLSQIKDLEDFFNIIGTGKLLCSIFDCNVEKKILSSITAMRQWISEISPQQALLLLLLVNKKYTLNVNRSLALILQGIAFKRISKAAELDVELEVVEKENVTRSTIQCYKTALSQHEAHDELLEEMTRIAKNTANATDKPFDKSSEAFLKSLLEKRSNQNPSYLRVMAHYVGLGMLKSQVS